MDARTVELVAVVRAAQAGDLEAFGELVRRFQDLAYAAALASLGDHHRAQDAAQEAFLAAFTDLRHLREPAAFPGWFRQIVARQCGRQTRRRAHDTVPLARASAVADGRPAPDRLLEANETGVRVRAAIQGLPERERLATALYYIGEFSQAEVAAFLDVPVTTVKRRLYSARQRLRERIERLMDTADKVETDGAVRGAIQEHRPSRGERFADEVKLLAAVKSGAVPAIAALLDRDPTLIDTREQDQPLLEIAGTYGYSGRTQRYKPVVDLLRARGAAYDIFAAAYLVDSARAAALLDEDRSLVHARDAQGMTALHHAAERGATDVARLLVGAGADVNALDARGDPPLHHASHAGPWKGGPAQEVVRLLLDHGAEVNVFLAAGLGATDRLRALLDADPSLVRATDQSGATPLYHAAHNLHLAAIDLLLERGADVNARRTNGESVVSTAVAHSWDQDGPEAVARLRAAGAVLDLFDACAVGDATRLKELLQERPERLQDRFWGETLLHVAARFGQPAAAEVVIAAGLDVNVTADNGETPTDSAGRFGKADMLEWLQARGGRTS